MNINDNIHFSPSVLLKDLDLTNKNSLISAFEERMTEYFLKAIKLLNDQNNAYASAIIEFSMIDALAKYSVRISPKEKNPVKYRVTKLLQNNFSLETVLSERAYDEFRNGLLHENNIKNSGQLCYTGSSKSFSTERGCLIVNPRQLEIELRQFFQSYIEKLKTDEEVYSLFLSHIKGDFEKEIAFFNQTN
ncbi:hypothetical protein [Dysgonomonas sp. 520]|uniref:hypothetical protein n=1 Tax=Dysgonomonas sp. 520 TaxID=2302931 RepID=UPI0013D70B4F|nr:hypothetical protein [Dysgonomonas sp. 520]NDW09181.1 hypothetical protein [Dysgonomonas sp. 520]